jgi:hypothetical protein
MDMAFYEYRQNNSGGGFDFDANAGISVYVIIEAEDAEHADLRAQRVGLYFGGEGDCSCCGDRWYNASEYDKSNVPSVCGDPIQDVDFEVGYHYKWINDGPEAYVHFADGEIQGYGLPKKQIG